MSKLTVFVVTVLSFSCTVRNSPPDGNVSALDSVRNFLQASEKQIASSPDSAFSFAEKALHISQRTDMEANVMFEIFFALGNSAEKSGQYDPAISYFLKTLEFSKKTAPERLATIYNHIGQIAFRQGRYDIAMEYFPKALEIRADMNDAEGRASSFRNIGSVYQAEWKYKEAEEHYEQSLKLYRQLGNIEGQADCYNNMGGLFAEQGLHEQALENYRKSESLYREINSPGLLTPMYNTGLVYQDMGNSGKAGEYYRMTLDMAAKWPENKRLLAEACYTLADYMGAVQQPDSAIAYYGKAIETAQQSDIREIQVWAFTGRGNIYTSIGKHREATDNYRAAISISQELDEKNQDRVRLFTRKYMEYETEAFRKQQLQHNRMLRNFIVALSFVALLVCIIAVLLYRNNIRRQKLNVQLAKQRDKIAGQHKEISESIDAASLVQKAVLPPQEYIQSIIPEYFILYLPRNVVSGDFYWATQKGRYTVVAVADCTGHGVSGAIVSMLGISSLNKIAGRMDIPHSNAILDELRDDIARLLNPEGTQSYTHNGMDMSLAVIDAAGQEIEFSGAINPLYLVRNGELSEMKADKMSISFDSFRTRTFSRQQIKYGKNDMIYMFSDGYIDQFDRSDQEKFKKKRFKDLIVSIAAKPLEEQFCILKETHLEWRGNTEQTDDILIVGIKL
jgi:tetratricopeptide (TPR) repeat protein